MDFFFQKKGILLFSYSLVVRLTRGLGSKSWVKMYLMKTVMCAGRNFSISMSWKGPSILGTEGRGGSVTEWGRTERGKGPGRRTENATHVIERVAVVVFVLFLRADDLSLPPLKKQTRVLAFTLTR